MNKFKGGKMAGILGLLLVSSLIPVSSITLNGEVSNNPDGRIGIRCSHNKVVHVYDHGSAVGIIYEGDTILEADGHKGCDHIDQGQVGTYVTIKLKRGQEIKTVVIRRVDKKLVCDVKGHEAINVGLGDNQ